MLYLQCKEDAGCDVAVNTEVVGDSLNTELVEMTQKVHNLEQQLEQAKTDLDKQKFSLRNIASDDHKVCFYTSYPSYKSLMACFEFLGPAAHQLSYSSLKSNDTPKKSCRPRSLPPLE